MADRRLCSVPVRVRYPRLSREHTTYGHMISGVDIAERLAHLADWDQEFTVVFGLTTAALRRVCRALTNAVYNNLPLDHRKATTFSGNNLLVFCCVCRLRADTGDQPPQGGHLIRCHRGSRP
jgi:hypothetical protein